MIFTTHDWCFARLLVEKKVHGNTICFFSKAITVKSQPDIKYSVQLKCSGCYNIEIYAVMITFYM